MAGISIGLPVVDGLDQFSLAVRSIFAQSYPDWELIIVCDGSPRAVAEKALRIQDERVRVVVHEQNRGLPTRLNEISEMAGAPFIARMDSDDVMHPERLSTIVNFMNANPHIDVVGSGSYLVDETYRVMGSYNEPNLPTQPHGYLNSGVFSHPTVAFKTSWALNNPYDPDRVRTEDKELWLRTFAFSTFAKMDERLLFCMVPRELSLRKQAITARYDRRLLLESGLRIAPPLRVYYKVAQSLVKQLLFFLWHRMGIIKQIHATKYSQISETELRQSQATLARMAEVAVPGWD